MIVLSEELKEYLEIARDSDNENETNICTDMFYLLHLHSTDFLHDCTDDFLVSSYADFIDGRAIIFVTLKGGCQTNGMTTISLENRSEEWKK